MRAMLKIGVILLVTIVGVVALAAVAILLFVDPNDYRDRIAAIVQEKTGRSLAIEGELDLKLFPWLAIDIHEVTLGNPPGYGEQPFMRVRTASVGVKLLPLLRKQVQVRRVSLDGLVVRLVSRSDDDNNWKDFGEKDEPAEAPSPAEESAQTSIGGVDVSNATLIYVDEVKQAITRLTGLELHTGPIGESEPIDARFAFDYDTGGAALVAHLESEARVLMPAGGDRIEIQNLKLNGEWFGSADETGAAKPGGAGNTASSQDAPAVRPSSKPIQFALSSPALVVDTKAETLAPATLDTTVGELPVKVHLQGEKLFGDFLLTGHIAIDKVSVRKVMASFDVEPPVTSHSEALSAFALETDLRVTPKQVSLNGLDATLDQTRLKGSAGVEDLDAMAVRFDLDVDAIDVDRYLAPEDEGAKTEAGAPAEPTQLPIELLRELNAKGRLRVGRAKVTGLEFTDVRLPVEALGGRARLGPTQAKLYGGAYEGDIVLDARPAVATLSTDEHLRDVDMGALMKAGFDTGRIAGKGNANARLRAAGNTDAALFDSLAGKIDFDVRNGALTGLDLWYELRRALALFKRQPVPERPAGEPKTAFNALSGSAVIDDGVLHNDDLNVDMSYVRAKGKGTLALASQEIDYRLVTEIYKLPEGDGGQQMADLKAAEIPVTITGTVADMKVRPDVEGYLKSRFKKEVDRKVDEKKEELKQKLGDKLKGLFGE